MKIKCACGCGKLLPKNKCPRKNRKFIKGHNRNIVSKTGSIVKCDCGCGKSFYKKLSRIIRNKKHFFSYKCHGRYRKYILPPEQHPRWKGGSKTDQGYIEISKRNKRTLEHRIIASQKIGRDLIKSEVVHHLNGDRSDNRPKNINITTQSKHMKAHWKEWKVQGFFDPHKLPRSKYR